MGCIQNPLLSTASNSDICRQKKIKLDREKLLGDVACLGNLDDHNKQKACVMCKTGQVPLQRAHRYHMSKSRVLELLINGKQMLIIKILLLYDVFIAPSMQILCIDTFLW